MTTINRTRNTNKRSTFVSRRQRFVAVWSDRFDRHAMALELAGIFLVCVVGILVGYGVLRVLTTIAVSI